MKKSINIANRLDEVNGIVAACNGSTMSFEQAYELARFYYDFQDTNALIADAEVMAGEDLSGLREIAISLKAETTTLLNNIGRLDGIDFRGIANAHSRHYHAIFQNIAVR